MAGKACKSAGLGGLARAGSRRGARKIEWHKRAGGGRGAQDHMAKEAGGREGATPCAARDRRRQEAETSGGAATANSDLTSELGKNADYGK